MIKSIEKTFCIRKELYDDDNKPKAIVVLVDLFHPILHQRLKGRDLLVLILFGELLKKVGQSDLLVSKGS